MPLQALPHMPDSLLHRFFSPPDTPSLLAYGIHDPWLVALSLLIAVSAAATGMYMADQAVRQKNGVLRRWAQVSGSLALGGGIWAMHFIGMLAFSLCAQAGYDPANTLVSMLPGIAAAAVALSLLGRSRVGVSQLVMGGVLTGLGICTMHYTGMAAMRSSLTLHYDPVLFGASLLVAMALSTVALWISTGMGGTRLQMRRGWHVVTGGVVMGCAIASMHYAGMAAATFTGDLPDHATWGDGKALALMITLITMICTALVVAVNGLLRYRDTMRRLRENESRMRTLMGTAVDGVITIDAHGIVQEFNPSAQRIFGWSSSEVVGRNVNMLMANPHRTAHDGYLSNYLRSGEAKIIGKGREVEGLRKDGSSFPMRLAIGHARWGSEDLFVGFVTDISDRKNMELALRKSEQQLRALISNMPGITYRAYPTQGWPMAFISDAVTRVTGYPASDFMGAQPMRLFGDLIHPDDIDRVTHDINAAVAAGERYLLEYRVLHRNGAIHWMWENGSSVRGDDGAVRWLDGVILDITERKHMEVELVESKERAEQAAEARAAFVANMSHEIRTPMNAILGFTDVLLQDTLAPSQRRHLDIVRSSARSLLRLLNEILDSAKLDRGVVELELTDFNLLALIDELSSTLGATARHKGLHLTIRYDDHLPHTFHGDELRVRQVLTNLLGNAIKFTEEGGVTLTVSGHEGQVQFSVSDTGIGIAPDRLDAIFDPFVQADVSMSRRFGGTGLGTTISKKLVELMGGTIRAESTLGEGSAFHVSLPLTAAVNRTASPATPRQRSDASLRALRILVADDVPQNLELLRLLLERQGHSLVMAADGSEAVALARAGHFDVILMDVQMPGMDGLQATEAIRRDEVRLERPRTPVIALTASVLDADRRAARTAGMDGFSSKPVDIVALSQEIAQVLRLPLDGAAAPAHTPPNAPLVLDAEQGLARWAGEHAVYQQALQQFVDEHAQSASTYTRLHAQGDLAGLRALAHRVCGVAANLGFVQLTALLKALEQAAVSGESLTLFQTLQTLPEALAACRHAVPQRQRMHTAPVPMDTPHQPWPEVRAQALALTDALAHNIRRGAVDDAMLNDLASTLDGHLPPKLVDRIRRALDDFDFEQANLHLTALLTRIDKQPDSPPQP